MVLEMRKQSMAWMETDYSRDMHFRWKIKWRLVHLSALGIMRATAPNDFYNYIYMMELPKYWQHNFVCFSLLTGKIRSIGVSNFEVPDLQRLLQFAHKPVSVVQNFFDPFYQDRETRNFCTKNSIHYMGYRCVTCFSGFLFYTPYKPL